MSLIPWKDDYQTDIDMIDDQHKTLIDSINLLAKKTSEKADVKEISEHLFNVLENAMNNFIAKEEVFERYSYPGYKQHKSDHDAFNFKAQLMIQELSVSNTLSEATLEYLKDWVVNHIFLDDQNYADFLKENGIS